MRRSGVGDVLVRRAASGLRAGRRSPYTQSMTRTVATWRYTEALTVPALAAEMLDPSWRHADRPLVQFVMDWRRFPDQRPRVLAEEPPADIDHVIAAKWRRCCTRCASATGSQRLDGSTGTASTPASGCSAFRWIPPSATRSADGRRGL